MFALTRTSYERCIAFCDGGLLHNCEIYLCSSTEEPSRIGWYPFVFTEGVALNCQVSGTRLSMRIKGHHKLPGKGYILEVALGLGSRDFRLSFQFVPTKHISLHI
jgi:hypothetical protein